MSLKTRLGSGTGEEARYDEAAVGAKNNNKKEKCLSQAPAVAGIEFLLQQIGKYILVFYHP